MTNKESYISFCSTHDSIPLFHQPFWWDAVLESWDVEKFEFENASAYLPYAFYKKWGFSFSRNPFLTPYSGLLFEESNYTSAQKQGLFNLAQKFISKFSISQYDNHPSLSKKIISDTNKQTFLLSLKEPKESLFQNFKSSLRRQLRKAENNLTINEEQSIDTLYTFYLESMDRQKGKEIVPKELAANLYKSCLEKKCGNIFTAKDKDNNIHAAIWYVADKKYAYYLLGGSHSGYLGSGAMGYLLWHCIQKAKTAGQTYFDFEGSEVPGVARFFSTFGGERIEYPILSAPTDAKLSLLLKVKAKLGR